jgi:glycosyltransferase involved in cell wall biosynthesis
MINDWPFVSIIVPVFNGGRTIDALLTSLLALDYSPDQYEILIVDNKSTDDTRQRIQRYPVTLLEETEIQGSYAARNRGIEAAKGEILAFTDADCVVEPTWLKRLLVSHKEPCWGGFAGNRKAYPPANLIERYCAEGWMVGLSRLRRPFFQANSKGERVCSQVPILDYRSQILSTNGLVNSYTANVAYRHLVFEEIGYFDDRMTSGGDVDLAWRLQTQTDWRISIVPDAIVYHQHRTNLADLTSMYRSYGGGYAVLARKYSSDPERTTWQLMAESLLLMFLTVPSHLFKIMVRPLRALGRGTDSLFWTEPIITLLCALYYHGGKLEGAWRESQRISRNGG